MEQHIETILQILDGENITYEFNPEEKVIHAHCKNDGMEVECYFLFNMPNKVVSYSVCEGNIPDSLFEEVEDNLFGINQNLDKGYFDFDVETHCIAYYNDYQVHRMQTAADNEELKKFCFWSYQVFQQYSEAFYAGIEVHA